VNVFEAVTDLEVFEVFQELCPVIGMWHVGFRNKFLHSLGPWQKGVGLGNEFFHSFFDFGDLDKNWVFRCRPFS